MDNYRVSVEYKITPHEHHYINGEYQSDGEIIYHKSTVLLIYNKNRTKLILSQPMVERHCDSILSLIKNGKSGDIGSCVSLTELYFTVKNKILTIGVGYGGPEINLQITKDLVDAFVDINEFYNSVIEDEYCKICPY